MLVQADSTYRGCAEDPFPGRHVLRLSCEHIWSGRGGRHHIYVHVNFACSTRLVCLPNLTHAASILLPPCALVPVLMPHLPTRSTGWRCTEIRLSSTTWHRVARRTSRQPLSNRGRRLGPVSAAQTACMHLVSRSVCLRLWGFADHLSISPSHNPYTSAGHTVAHSPLLAAFAAPAL